MVLTRSKLAQRETHIPEKGFLGIGFIVEIINCLALEAVQFEHNTSTSHLFPQTKKIIKGGEKIGGQKIFHWVENMNLLG